MIWWFQNVWLMGDYFCHIPCGEPLPFHSPHAVSVSLPTLNDVIGYEEGSVAVIEKMKSGYPRFFRNQLVQQLLDYVVKHYQIESKYTVLPMTSFKAYEVLSYLIHDKLDYVQFDGSLFLLVEKEDVRLQQIKDYIRNAGLIISSRQAESSLVKIGLLKRAFEEERKKEHSDACVLTVLAQAYNTHVSNVVLTNSGANAVFSVCEALVALQQKKGKNIVIQLGWLYLDTMEVIEKRSEKTHLQLNIYDLKQLEKWLDENHSKVAVLITEVVSNPKIQCVDIVALYAICQKYDVKVVLDSTLITPFHAPVLQYCDVAVESLSKFACGKGDVLMGAILISKSSEISCEVFQDFVIPPFEEEVKRLAFEIEGYQERVVKSSENAKQLIQLLSKKKAIKKVWSVLEENAVKNYQTINTSGHIPGLVTIELEESIQSYYDQLKVAKGPSLGTEFTLVMPYVYLAHYDLTKTKEGIQLLNKKGMNPEILRVSVGVENIENIVKVFNDVFPDG